MLLGYCLSLNGWSFTTTGYDAISCLIILGSGRALVALGSGPGNYALINWQPEDPVSKEKKKIIPSLCMGEELWLRLNVLL
jgi:hypothetical protein